MATNGGANKKVCVTGAGGFIASWLVKLLLSKGYSVHGTVRQPGSKKYEHLLKLERASENLTLFEADILNYESLYKAIVGCSAVFHVASPVPSTVVSNPEVEVIEPAVKGTANVLEASLKAKVERVVFVSSGVAAAINPNFPKDKVIDESCWSDKEYCKKAKNWYCYAKTEAEEQALNFAKRTGLDVVSICPTLVLGPILQSTTNSSCDTLENKHRWIVDVRDVVDAILLVYENHKAEGRYICFSHAVTERDLVEKLKSIFPNYKYPTNYSEVDDNRMLSSEKLQSLGWKFRPLEETLIDSVKSYEEAGLL
ncbi:cinnamoyl-CoA reductase 2-like protein [Trifolium pratense]|uniref:Cinnamoyl-CoA reductase 2-like protein n=1 Tax=Trifolium pratense TaxID=57577 RepID=A0A2K3L6Q3_TRIPR|nr:cinnamoyl-CoA reductase 2-like protein [Trifolium pratense]